MTSEVLTAEEAAAYLKVNTVSLYRFLRDGLVPGYRVGTTWRIRIRDLEQWIEDQITGGCDNGSGK